jgi:SAM-dependent methyltransferase
MEKSAAQAKSLRIMTVRHLPYAIDPARSRQDFYENYWKKVGLDLLCAHCSPVGKSLLDYGCGRGEALGMARELGFEVTGTDADPECVRLAGRFGPTQQLDLEDPVAQFGRKSFDAVCCFHVLEHVENPRKVLSDFSLLARSFVVLAVPNLRQLNGLFQRKIDLTGFNEGHLQSWDHWHLLNLAERHCGLKLVQWGFDNTKLPLLSNLAQRLLGDNFAKRLETGVFLRIFPFHSQSIIGLFRVA